MKELYIKPASMIFSFRPASILDGSVIKNSGETDGGDGPGIGGAAREYNTLEFFDEDYVY